MLAGTAASAGAEPTVESKRAEAEQVLAQIQEIDASLDLAVDAYNGARVKLASIEAAKQVNARRLKIARSNFVEAQSVASKRLVALYTEGETSSIELLLGSTSLGELIDRVDAADRISEQDARIARDVRMFRSQVRKRAAALRQAHAAQERVVTERAARREEVEQRLKERGQLLETIKDEIAQLQAEEAARQRRLQAQARARLAARAEQAEASAKTSTSDAGSLESAAPAAATTAPTPPAAPAPPVLPPAPPAAPPAAEATPPSARYGGVVGIAMEYLGVPYRWGGASPETGFDCSGFIMYVYAKLGVSLPHHAASQYGYGTPVTRDQLEPGDLVFFNDLGHNGIYIGGGQFIHSPHTGDVVKISSLSDSWYAATWVGARRL